MNEALIGIFEDLAIFEDYNSIEDKSRQWPAKAYRKAVEILKNLDYEVTSDNVDELKNIRGVGKAIYEKARDYLANGTFKRYEEYLASPAPQIKALAKIKNVGMNRALTLFNGGVKSPEELKEKAAGLSVGDELVPGVKLTTAIKAAIENDVHSASNRMKIDEHNGIAEPIIEELKKVYGVKAISTAGSARRFDGSSEYSIGDIDIIIGSDGSNDAFIRDRSEELLDTVVMSGPTKISGVKSGRQVDIRIVPIADYGALLLHATGSADFNKECRRLAIKKGWKLNEYGLFDANGVCLSKDEAEILDMIGLGWVEPKDRIRGYKANI